MYKLMLLTTGINYISVNDQFMQGDIFKYGFRY